MSCAPIVNSWPEALVASGSSLMVIVRVAPGLNARIKPEIFMLSRWRFLGRISGFVFFTGLSWLLLVLGFTSHDLACGSTFTRSMWFTIPSASALLTYALFVNAKAMVRHIRHPSGSSRT